MRDSTLTKKPLAIAFAAGMTFWATGAFAASATPRAADLSGRLTQGKTPFPDNPNEAAVVEEREPGMRRRGHSGKRRSGKPFEFPRR